MRTPSRKAIATTGGAAAIALAGFLAFWENGPNKPPPTTAYQDSVGTWTICAGKTTGVHQGTTATVAECEAWLQEYAREDLATVARCIKPTLTLGQKVAFGSAVHNLGADVVCGSTLQQIANSGRPDAIDYACLQLVDAINRKTGLPTGWTNAGGKFLPGLLNRREAEVIVCIRGIE